MENNIRMTINGHIYTGVKFNSKEEAAELLHPSYWDKIQVGYKMIINNTVLIRVCENTMLLRNNGSRNFISIQ